MSWPRSLEHQVQRMYKNEIKWGKQWHKWSYSYLLIGAVSPAFYQISINQHKSLGIGGCLEGCSPHLRALQHFENGRSHLPMPTGPTKDRPVNRESVQYCSEDPFSTKADEADNDKTTRVKKGVIMGEHILTQSLFVNKYMYIYIYLIISTWLYNHVYIYRT